MDKPLSIQEFFDLAERSGVLSEETLDQLRSEIEQSIGDASTLADSMVASSSLTRWQADRLLAGRHKGFLLGKYRLLDLIGRGAMGSVYLAEHTLLNRRAAVKVMPINVAKETSQIERFMREAQAVAALDHQNIVRAYDVDILSEGGKEIYYLAMEYIVGETIERQVRDGGAFDFIKAADVTRQVANGLVHAHTRGLIHRDIKPSNLLVDAENITKILDLGLVGIFDADESASITQTHNESLLGTVDYISPEQALDSHDVDHRTDLYSLGCTFYFMLTGHAPFPQGTVARRLAAHQNQPAPPIRIDRPDVPAGLAAIISALMAKDPHQRYQSAEHVARDLTEWLIDNSHEQWKANHPSFLADAARYEGSSVRRFVFETSPDVPDPNATFLGPLQSKSVSQRALTTEAKPTVQVSPDARFWWRTAAAAAILAVVAAIMVGMAGRWPRGAGPRNTKSTDAGPRVDQALAKPTARGAAGNLSEKKSQTTAARPLPPPPDPVGYWAFEAGHFKETNVLDKSGNRRHAKIFKANIVAGKLGSGLEFADVTCGLEVKGLGMKGHQRSVSMWIKRRKMGMGVQRLVFFDDYNQVGFADANIFVHTGQVARVDFNMPLANVRIPLDQWVHLAITWDTGIPSENVKVYVDGSLRIVGTLFNAKGRSLRADTVRIGFSEVKDNQTFQGAVDEIAVYNRALTAEQIKRYYRGVSSTAGNTNTVIVQRTIQSQVAKPPRPYVPKTRYTGPKKLIRVGSELVSKLLGAKSVAEADLPTKVKAWQQTGLDGLVFSIASHRQQAGVERNMSGQWWNLIRRDYGEFVPEIRAFQSVKSWGRLTDNFLWSSMAIWGSSSAKCQDWFSDKDWETILSNVRLQARVAREAGFRGILLDAEQYTKHHGRGTWRLFFNYATYAEDGYKLGGEPRARAFAEVAAKVRQRGEQYARALCAEFPGIRLIVLPSLYDAVEIGNLEQVHHGLYPSFLDGVLVGLDEKARLIGGNEVTYGMTTYADISNVRRRHDEALERLCKVPAEMKRKVSFAAGIWAEAGAPWSTTRVENNVRSPKQHERAIRNAFKSSGEYSWLYGETSFFLTMKPTPLMRRYYEANRQAHQLREKTQRR